MCEKYLLTYHEENILQLLEDPDVNKHYSININFIELFENDPLLGKKLFKTPETCLEEWDKSLISAQNTLIAKSEKLLTLKKNVHCRIHSLIRCPELHKSVFPRNDDADKFLQVSGRVVRMTGTKILEYQRIFKCGKCKYEIIVKSEYENKNIIKTPKSCTNPEGCNSTNIKCDGEMIPDFCKDYQEIKIQETVNKYGAGSMPNSMWVSLEDDLVDSCKPGDNIIICGIVKRRWGNFVIGKSMSIELVIKANHIQISNDSGSVASVTPEIKKMFKAFWETYADNPLGARDIILRSICPQLFGLHIVKLAVAVVLAGGSSVQEISGTGVKIRSEPHLLLVGDPGTGKSQLLRFASKIIPRSVLTTGVGSTAAGLTVTAVMEGGEWQLEGGALVLADGGICCIDEFNSMKAHDRTSIHEAMEQQTISVAKASIVCKLSTRCSILAATNPKGNLDSSQPLHMNIALASPLLSRFDLILLLKDSVNDKWDNLVTDFILNIDNNSSKLTDNMFWTVETLQAYFSIIKKNHPILTTNSNRILSNYYQAQRRQNVRNKSRTTVRLLDSLVRLSQGHARLMYHQQVEIVDAIMAVMLVETSMDTDSSVFNLQFDVQSDFPDSPMIHYRALMRVVLKKLQLDDLLEQEELELKRVISNRDELQINANREILNNVGSKYFLNRNHSRDGINGKHLFASKRKIALVENQNSIGNENVTIEKNEVTVERNSQNISINNKTDQDILDNPPKKINKGKTDEVADDIANINQIPSLKNPFLEFDNSDNLGNIDDFDPNNFVSSTQITKKKSPLKENQSILKPTEKFSSPKEEKVTKRKEFFKKFKFVPKIDPKSDSGEEKNEDQPSTSKTSCDIRKGQNKVDISNISSQINKTQISSQKHISIFETEEDLDLDFD